MSMFRRKKKEGSCPVPVTRDSEAARAKERALLDQREAQQDLDESLQRAHTSRRERMKNHFGPLIYKAMGPK